MWSESILPEKPKNEETQKPLCPICGSEKISKRYDGEITNPAQISFNYVFSPNHFKTFPVLRCNSCTHVFCWPIPEDIAQHYVDSVDPEYLQHRRHRQLTAHRVFKKLARYIGHGRLLDVGCATGDYLLTAKEHGFNVEGLEISECFFQIAKDSGLTIHRERLSRFVESHENTYDLITLIGVLHEFQKPAEEIGYVRRLLKPGGYLAIWTGNVDSITSKLLGRKWWYWQGQHINYFSQRSLEWLMASQGMKYVSTDLYPFAATYENIRNSIRRYSLHRWMNLFLKPLFKIKPVWYLRIPGEMLFVARRPVGPLYLN